MKNESGFTPNGDLVLILPPPVEEKTAGGIVIPKSAQDKEQLATRMGVLIAAGEDAMSHPRMKGIEIGDNVLFPRYRGDPLPVDKVIYLIMRAGEILGPMNKVPDYMIGAAKPHLETFGANVPEAA